MIPVEITNYQDRETGQHHCFPSVPDFRKLSTPLVRVSAGPVPAVAKIPALSRPMKSKLVAGYRIRPPRGRATLVVVKIGDDTARRRERGMAVAWRWWPRGPRICVSSVNVTILIAGMPIPATAVRASTSMAKFR